MQTVNWEAGKEGAAETGVKRGLTRVEGLNREVQTGIFSLQNASVSVHNVRFIVYSGVRGPPQFLKKAPRMQGKIKIFHGVSHQFRESLWELLRELWLSHCSSRETPCREWDFSFRELFSGPESCSENNWRPPRGPCETSDCLSTEIGSLPSAAIFDSQSHKRVLTLICWQPGNAKTGFCSILAISSCGFSLFQTAGTPFLCHTLALSHFSSFKIAPAVRIRALQKFQRKAKRQQLKGKIVSALSPRFFALFGSLRGSWRGRVFRVFSEVFRVFLEVFRGPLRDPLRGRFPSLRASQSCSP